MAAAAPLLLSAGVSIAGGIAAKKGAEADAKTQRRIGQVEAADQRRETKRLIASQEAAFGSSGVAIGTGSPLDVAADTISERELAALRIRFSRNSQSDSLKRDGEFALFSGITSSLGTILGGVGEAKRQDQVIASIKAGAV